MKIIGLVGGSGSGKGTVSELFSKYNFAHIDTDNIYHELTSGATPCTEALRLEFGDGVIKEDGSLDRRALSKIVFADGAREKLRALNSITHKFVLDEVRRLLPSLALSGYAAVLVDAPLLFESGFDKECDTILCVTAPKDVRISRIVARDGISPDAAERRISSQKSDDELIERSDFAIENSGDRDELLRVIDGLVPLILK